METYLWAPVYWAPRAFQKVGLNQDNKTRDANETTSHAQIVGMTTNKTCAVINLEPPAFTHTTYGGPCQLQLLLQYLSSDDGLTITLIAKNKTPTHLI